MKTNLLTRTGICIALASSLFFSACGGGTTTNPPDGCGTSGASPCPTSDFVYATAPGAILGFTANTASGALSAPTSVPGPTGMLGIPSFGIVKAQGFLYVSDAQNNQVDGFSVNKTSGVLTPLSSSPFSLPLGFPALEEPMAANAQGKFIYLAHGGTIDAFSIDSTTGALAAVPGSPFASGSPDLGICIDRSGKFLFAFSTTSFGVLAYTITPGTGALVLVPGSPFILPITGSGDLPSAMIVDSSGAFLYAVVQTPGTTLPFSQSGYIAGFSVDSSSGALTPVSGAPVVESSIVPFVIATAGTFVYTRSAQGISAFNIGAGTGTLTEISGSPFAAGDTLGGMAVSNDGKFMYEGGVTAVGAFAIDPITGAVSASGAPVSAAGAQVALTYY